MIDAEFLARASFVLYVDLRRGVVADQHHRKSGSAAVLLNEVFHARAAFCFDLIADQISVEYLGQLL